MAIVALYRAGYVKYIVTQNVDGLHLKVSTFSQHQL
jgi:NAD-dependent SIR2 family protein deacetylase